LHHRTPPGQAREIALATDIPRTGSSELASSSTRGRKEPRVPAATCFWRGVPLHLEAVLSFLLPSLLAGPIAGELLLEL
jgi:hypothetical protein